MVFLVTTLIAGILVWICAPAIHRHPWILYALVIVIDVLFLAGTYTLLPGPASRFISMFMRRGILAIALFTVVMYIGVLPRDSAIRLRFNSVRAELSIAACILVAAHIASYIVSFLPRLFRPDLQPNLAVSLSVAVVLLVLILILGVTSFRFVKERMDGRHWKTVQRFAYLFYGLVFIHILFMLGPGALSVSTQNRINFIIYMLVFTVYAIARIARWRLDRSAGIGASSASSSVHA